jgi:hypothetical protein
MTTRGFRGSVGEEGRRVNVPGDKDKRGVLIGEA